MFAVGRVFNEIWSNCANQTCSHVPLPDCSLQERQNLNSPNHQTIWFCSILWPHSAVWAELDTITLLWCSASIADLPLGERHQSTFLWAPCLTSLKTWPEPFFHLFALCHQLHWRFCGLVRVFTVISQMKSKSSYSLQIGCFSFRRNINYELLLVETRRKPL